MAADFTEFIDDDLDDSWVLNPDADPELERLMREEAIPLLRDGTPPPFPSAVQVLSFVTRKRMLAAMPSPHIPGDRLYLLSFEGPVPYLKAGRTKDVGKRLKELEHAARNHCYGLADGWISRPVGDARQWEEDVIRELTQQHLGKVRSRPSEYLHQADFTEMLAIAERVSLPRQGR